MIVLFFLIFARDFAEPLAVLRSFTLDAVILYSVVPTVTLQTALTLLPSLAVAVMVAVPCRTPRIVPLAFTVATAVLELVQVTLLLAALDGLQLLTLTAQVAFLARRIFVLLRAMLVSFVSAGAGVGVGFIDRSGTVSDLLCIGLAAASQNDPAGSAVVCNLSPEIVADCCLFRYGYRDIANSLVVAS